MYRARFLRSTASCPTRNWKTFQSGFCETLPARRAGDGDFVPWGSRKVGNLLVFSRCQGCPGWHIECSVMSKAKYSGEQIDIHAGGEDLIFITRTRSPRANPPTISLRCCLPMYNAFLNIDNRKMSTTRVLLYRAGAGGEVMIFQVLRFMLSAHYRSPRISARSDGSLQEWPSARHPYGEAA